MVNASKEKTSEYNRRYREKHYDDLCRYQLWKNARTRAEKKGIEFALTMDDVVIPEACPVLGFELIHGHASGKDNSPSIDRRDNSEGYTPANIQVISNRANRIKNDATIDELRRIITYMENDDLPDPNQKSLEL